MIHPSIFGRPFRRCLSPYRVKKLQFLYHDLINHQRDVLWPSSEDFDSDELILLDNLILALENYLHLIYNIKIYHKGY